jgi:hypothetical protein
MTAADPETAGARAEPWRLAGGCHCGSLEVTFETRVHPGEIPVRACGCSFCRRHGVRTVSDPEGRIEFVAHDPAHLSRYTFGLGTAEFLMCRNCGVYVGAITVDAGPTYAIVNINALQTPEVFAQAAVPVSYDRESEAERRARRRDRWTPAAVVGPSDPGETFWPDSSCP